MFRQAAAHHLPRGRVLWGPFPARWGVLGTAFAALVIAVAMVGVTWMHERLRCGVGEGAACVIDGQLPFARGDIRSVDVVIEKGSRNATYGVVTLRFDGGAQKRMMRVEPSAAREAAATIQSALETGEPIDVDVHEPRWMAGIGVVALAIPILCFIAALARMGHFDLVISPDGRTLVVRRSVFLVPLGTAELPIARVVGVRLERKVVTPPLGRTGQTERVARLLLVDKTGVQPLSDAFFPGDALHYRAAAALRAALDVEPDPQDDAALAAIPMRSTPLGTRLGAAWAGITTEGLAGLAIFGVTMMLAGQLRPRDNLEGWVFLGGMVPGAIAGAAIVMHATRTRLPR